MNTIKTIMLLLIIAVFTACSNDDDAPKNNAPVVVDMAMDFRGVSRSGLITTIAATDLDEDTLTYSLVSQTPANSVSVNSVNGEVYVSNASAFDYDLNQSITVNIKVSDSKDETTAQLVITIIDPN